jgi:hypothetical protein
MTQLLALYGEDLRSDPENIRGEEDEMGFLPIPGMTTALAIRALRRKRRGKKGKHLLLGQDIRGEEDEMGFMPIPGMTTALAIRALRRKRRGKKGKHLFFGDDIRGEEDEMGFLPIPGMTTALAIRALRRKRRGKKGKHLFFGDDIRGEVSYNDDIRGDEDDLGFAATAATVATGLFKGLKKFGKSKTFKALQKSKLGKKLSIKRKKKPAAKKATQPSPVQSIVPVLTKQQFKTDFQDAVKASDMSVVPKSEIVANQEALKMLTTENEKSTRKLFTAKNMAIGGGVVVGGLVLVKVLTHKKSVPVHVGLGRCQRK